jgi:DHA1 family tetracycline resistance protein-like MFS transporter
MNPLVPQLFSGGQALFPHAGYGTYGLLVAVFPFCAFCSSFVLAGASDRYGRKRLLLLSLAGTVVGYLLLIAALATRNLLLVFVARAVDGITGGNVGIVQAAIADITPRDDRSSKLGMVGGAFGLGLIIGPVLGGTLASSFSLAMPFVFAAGVAAINALLVFGYLPELPLHAAESLPLLKDMPSHIVRYFSAPKLRNILTANFLYNCAMTCFNAFLPVLLVERFGFGAEQVGLFYGYVGIIYAINQFIIVPRIDRRFSPKLILTIGVTALSCIMLLYATVFAVPALFPIAILFTLANGTNQANLVGLLSTTADPNEQGRVLGLNSSLISLAQTVLPPLAGLMAANLAAGLPLFVAAFFMASAALVLVAYVFVPRAARAHA